MSLRLPSLPNVGYLKKHAKDVLRVARRRNPHCRLADAQHALARGYGFRSWPELKTHIESVRRPEIADVVTQGRRIKPRRGSSPIRVRANAAMQSGPSGGSHPMAGTWTTGKPFAEHTAQCPGELVVDVEVTGDTVTLTQIVADQTGQQSATMMSVRADGREHPVDIVGLLVRARWTHPGTLEVIAQSGGAIVGKATYTVSQDGQSLVASTTNQVVTLKRI